VSFRLATSALLLAASTVLVAGPRPLDNGLDASIQRDTAELRVAHLSPDAPAVDVWLNGAVVLSGVTYPALSGYLSVPADTQHQVQVFVAGSAVDPVIDAQLSFGEGTASTVAATGLLSDGSFGPAVFNDERASSPSSAWVRFVHAGADAPAVDITLTDGTVLFGNVSFNEGTAYLPVTPGSVDLQVRLAGSETVVLSYGGIELAAETTLSVWATGTLADGTLGAGVSVESPGMGSGLTPLEAAMAKLRVAHLSPDAPAVDVWVNGSAVLAGVAYPALSGYLEVPAATHLVQVFVAGSEVDPVIDAQLTPLPGQALSVVASGLLGDGSFGPAVFEDQLVTVEDQAQVRFIHTGADAPAVDITLTDGTVVFGNVAFNQASAYLALAAGSYDLQVRLAGTETVVLGYGAVGLPADANITVWAAGTLAEGTLGAWVSVDAPGDGAGLTPLTSATARLRVAHLSPDAPAVDVWLDGAPVLSNVPYPTFSSYLELSAASHHVQVFVAGSEVDPVIDAQLTPLPGQALSVAATGLIGDGSFGPLVTVDDLGTLEGQARVRFIHTAGDAPAVDITLPDGTVLFGDVAFNEVQGPLAVAAGSVPLQVRLAGSDTVVLSFDPVDLEAQTVYSVWAVGSLAGGSLGAWATVDAPGDGSTALQLEISTAVAEALPAPLSFRLGEIYPNPFNPSTTIRFTAGQTAPLRLSVFDLLGRRVATLVDGRVAAGEHQVVWDAGTSASGLYLVQLEGPGLNEVRRVSLIR
jgi:hypothetical protein